MAGQNRGKGKTSRKGTKKYLKYRNGPQGRRPQRTGANKTKGPDTGSKEIQEENRRKKITAFARMVAKHKDPLFALRNLVPKSVVYRVTERLTLEGEDVFK